MGQYKSAAMCCISVAGDDVGDGVIFPGNTWRNRNEDKCLHAHGTLGVRLSVEWATQMAQREIEWMDAISSYLISYSTNLSAHKSRFRAANPNAVTLNYIIDVDKSTHSLTHSLAHKQTNALQIEYFMQYNFTAWNRPWSVSSYNFTPAKTSSILIQFTQNAHQTKNQNRVRHKSLHFDLIYCV